MVVVSHFKINFERLNNVFAKLGIKYYSQPILIFFFIFSTYIGSTQVSDPWIYIGGDYPAVPNIRVSALQKYNTIDGSMITLAEAYIGTDIAFHPDGRLFGCLSAQIFEMDTSGFAFPANPKRMIYTGDIQHVYFAGMTIDHKGLIWLIGHNGIGRKRAVFTYDLNTNILTEVGLLPWELSYLDVEWYNGEIYAIGHRIPVDGDIMLTKINLKNFDLSENIFFPENIKSWGLVSVNNECESLELYATSGTFFIDPRGLYHFNAALDGYTYINNPKQSAATGATSRTSWLGSYTPLGIDSIGVTSQNNNCSPPYSITAHPKKGYYMRPDIQYSLDGITYQQDSVFNNLLPGKYVVHLKDSLGCFKKSDSITVGNYATFNYISAIKEDYCGLGNGMIELKSNNHTAFSADQINFIADSLKINNLNAGNYSFILRNTKGCLDTMEITIPEIKAFTVLTTAISDSCGQYVGGITIIPTGQQGNISISMDGINFISSDELSGLTSGNYPIQIKDSAGCIINDIVKIDNIPGPRLTQIKLTQPDCNQNNGILEISSTSDQITYYLNNMNNTTGLFNNLSAGEYTLTIKDANACRLDTLIQISGKNAAIIDSVIIDNAHCNIANGIIQIFTHDSEDVSISLDGINYLPGNQINWLDSGQYSIIIKNKSGCISTAIASITQTGMPYFESIDITDASCDKINGALSITMGGYAPLACKINQDPYVTTPEYDGLAPGSYILELRDEYGCTVDSIIKIKNNGKIPEAEISVINTDCTSPYGEILVNGAEDIRYEVLENNKHGNTGDTLQLIPGLYHLQIKNEYCIIDTTVMVTASDCPIFIPNVFTPNHDGINDELEVFMNGNTILTGMTIIDRWGGVKYACTGSHCKWDGTYQGKVVEPGVFIVLVKYKNNKGEDVLIAKDVTVIY